MTKTQANEPGFVDKLEADSLDAIVEVIGAPRLYNDGKSAMRKWFLNRLRAATPIVPAPAYGVKELEWSETSDSQYRSFDFTSAQCATGFGGYYRIEERLNGRFDVWFPNEGTGQPFATEDQAKAAAQADFERRILSCLSSAPVEEADAKTEEPLAFGYTNWRGEFAERNAIPLRIERKESEWHGPGLHWVMVAFDLEKQAERDFLIKDIGPASTIPSEPEAKGEAGADHECKPDPMGPERCVTCGKRFRPRNQKGEAGAGPVGEAWGREEDGEWSKMVGPLVQRFEVAGSGLGNAVHNPEGAAAIAKLMRTMARKLDGGLANVEETVRQRMAALSTQESSAALAGDGKEVGL